MQHKIFSLIIAVLFLVVVQSFSGVFRFLLGAIIIYTAMVSIYNYRLLKAEKIYNFWLLLRPALFIASLFFIYLILPNALVKGLVLLASVLLLYFVEAALTIASEQVLFLETLVTYFGFALGIFGFNFYLLPRTFFVLASLLLLTFFASRSSFESIPNSEAKRNFYSWLISLLIVELAWAGLFLPIHFTILAVMLFNAFYVLWMLVYYYLLHNLNPKKVLFHFAISIIIIILALISTPWKA